MVAPAHRGGAVDAHTAGVAPDMLVADMQGSRTAYTPGGLPTVRRLCHQLYPYDPCK